MTDGKSIGVELRRMRLAAGLSLSELARLFSRGRGYLSEIETGAMPPNVAPARRRDVRLGAGGTLCAPHNEIRRMPARVPGLAARREAQGRALAGDRDDTPVLGTSLLAKQAVLTRARHDLGRPAETEIRDGAMAAIQRRRRLLGAPRHPARVAHAAAGEVTHACSLVADLLPKVRPIDSGTVRSDVRRSPPRRGVGRAGPR